MAHETIQRTIAGETDSRLIVDNAHTTPVRTLLMGSSWNSMRLAIRVSCSRTSDYTSPPSFYFGLTSGKTAPPGSVTPNHFIGVKSNTQTWRYRTTFGSPECIQLSFNSCLIANGSESGSIFGAQGDTFNTPTFSINTSGRSVFMLEIIKGSPWTLKMWSLLSNSTYASHRNKTVEELQSFIQQGTVPTGFIESSTTAFTPNEATYGYFDSACVYFSGTPTTFEVNDIIPVRLS